MSLLIEGCRDDESETAAGCARPSTMAHYDALRTAATIRSKVN